jgi:hypothetical protein
MTVGLSLGNETLGWTGALSPILGGAASRGLEDGFFQDSHSCAHVALSSPLDMAIQFEPRELLRKMDWFRSKLSAVILKLVVVSMTSDCLMEHALQ